MKANFIGFRKPRKDTDLSSLLVELERERDGDGGHTCVITNCWIRVKRYEASSKWYKLRLYDSNLIAA